LEAILTALPRGWLLVVDGAGSWQSIEALLTDHADLAGVELRLDLCDGPDWLPTLPDNLSVLVTDRGNLDCPRRIARRDQICRQLQGILDIDLTTDAPPPDDLQWIYSSHRHAATGDSPQQQIDRARQLGAVAAKIVFPEGDLDARRSAVAFGDHSDDFPVVSFCAGNQSRVDRLLAVDRHQRWGYATATDLLRDTGVPEISRILHDDRFQPHCRNRPLLAIIGADVGASLSPGWHNRCLQQLQEETRLISFSCSDPQPFLQLDPAIQFDGMAVTAPHKLWARNVAQPLDELARRQPSWNTLIRTESNRWVGTSTDAIALQQLIPAARSENSTALIVGTGGAGQVAGQVVEELGYQVQMWGRNHHDSSDIEVIEAAQLLINATGAARHSLAELPWPLERFRGGVLMEMGYHPPTTSFLEQLARPGMEVIDGIQFFTEQARHQARLLYGAHLDREEAQQLTLATRQKLHFNA